MKKEKASLTGRLYYTFGTVLLLALIAICAINFSRDGRVFQKPVLTASKPPDVNSSKDHGKKESDSIKTIKYTKKNDSKSASGNKKNKPEQQKTTPNATEPRAPVNPGENP